MNSSLEISKSKNLLLTFFKFKIDTKNKIQSFIDKLESAHKVKNTIQQFAIIREYEEKKNSPESKI